ncbi:MAG: alpha-2-macroglobulin family protein, partial [Rhizobiales bacterium]|nr:alpha-2-macroglobulin family protein [Hyphomicrobiales bacterium]
MIGMSVRAAFAAGLLALCSITAQSAEKAYQRDDLADAAIKLEAEIKKDNASVDRPVATLRRDVAAAIDRRDFRAAVQGLSQIVVAEPAVSGNWLRLSQNIVQLPFANNSERTQLLERASTAAYIAYQRATNDGEDAEGLAQLGRLFAQRRLWRPALDTMRMSLELREVADLRQQYETARGDHGPRICFQFSEELPGKRTDFSPFVSVAGMDKPALSVDGKQICVEGLKHGERYSVALRAGLPSTVKEALSRSADFNVYVRDRKPFVRFTGRAYVLPKIGQQGIPVVTVNTEKVKVNVLRVGDRNLMSTVLGREFQRNLDRYDVERLADERGIAVWKGEMSVEKSLNLDVTTAFPVEQAVPDMKPGVYVMTAEPDGPQSESYEAMATQWFIVSDLGLTAYSGADGVHAFVQSLATADAVGGVEVRLIARSNEVLSVGRTDASGAVHFPAGLSRGEGGMSPAMLVAAAPQGDYAFLNLKGPAFDLSDRGVAGRAPARGLDAFVYAERGVYRTGETVHLTALLRNAQGIAAPDTAVTLVMERPDGVEYRRTVLPDQGLGGRTLSVPIVSSAPTGTWRVRVFVDPKGAAVGQTTFMVEDYVPDRMEFDLASAKGRIVRGEATEVTLDGRYLYGAPASGLGLEGEAVITAASERPGLAGYQFGVADEDTVNERVDLEDLPETDEQGKAAIPVTIEKVPDSSRPLEAKVTIRMAESGGRAVERSITLPIEAARPMIGVKPLFTGSSLGEGDLAAFDVLMVAPDGKKLDRKGLRYELLKVESRYQWYRQDNRWEYEPVKSTTRVADGRIDVGDAAPGRISAPVTWGRYRLEVSTDDADGPVTTVTFGAGFYADASADTPDLLESALDKTAYRGGDTMNVAVTARSAGKVTLSVVSDRLVTTTTTDVQAGTVQLPLEIGTDWGTGAYVVATLRRPLDAQAKRMPGRAIGVQW